MSVSLFQIAALEQYKGKEIYGRQTQASKGRLPVTRWPGVPAAACFGFFACLVALETRSPASGSSRAAEGVSVPVQSGRETAPSAQNNKPEPAPTADQLLERYVRALGGEPALKKITSRYMKGKFEAPLRQPGGGVEMMTGEAEILTAAPDKFYSHVSITGQGEFISAFDGKIGWSSDPRDGVREMQGPELESMRRSSQFQHELRFREIFPQLRVLDKAAEGGRPVWVLEAAPPSGSIEKFYFDAESALLVRHDSTQLSPGSEVPIEHRYSDYAPVDGVQVPRVLRHKDPNVEWQVTFTEILQNVTVDPSRFAKPAAP